MAPSGSGGRSGSGSGSGSGSDKSFTRVIRCPLRIDDQTWHFSVPTVPRIDGFVKKLALRTDMKLLRHELVLSLERVQPSRAIKYDSLDRFLVVSLEDFRPAARQQQQHLSSGTKPPSGEGGEEVVVGMMQPATWKECTDYSVRLLDAGVVLNGTTYHFYGHSNSQLKSRTCFLFAGTKEEIGKKVDALGDFAKIKTVAKKAKRIGLLFSVAEVAMEVRPERVEDIPDVERDGYVFTDGCGLISPHLARELARRRRILYRGSRYCPSVFQIRYRGYKGVVEVDERMEKEEWKTKGIWLRMRKSMRKFAGGEDWGFAVVEWSKPYTFGYLNDESIIHLDALGIPRAALVRMQEEHLRMLAEASTNGRQAMRFLSYIGQHELVEKMLLDGLDTPKIQSEIKRLVGAEHSKMLNKRDEQKCRIFVEKSRLLFGVCDAWDVLKEGDCAVRVTPDGALVGTEVIVIRNPSLHPGDWRKLKVVDKPELAHLWDCIVFPTRGRRPPADMMSGGDLDGDTFFVCWDPRLIPSTISQPADYPGGREPVQFKAITDFDRLVYFAKYTNASLGKVKKLYMAWVKATGVRSQECQELNRLFSQCVDGNLIRIPKRLESPPDPKPDAPAFVLDDLHERAQDLIRRTGLGLPDLDGQSIDAVELLAAQEDIAMTEFELIKVAFRWCRKNGVSTTYLIDYFDMSALTDEQKAWVMAEFQGEAHLSTLMTKVVNALCSSNLLSAGELAHFKLDDANIHWKRVFDSSSDRMATFLDSASRTMDIFHRKLVVFRPDERLTLAVYIPRPIEPGREVVVDDRVRLFAFPHSQGPERQSRLSLPTKMTYRLYCDGNVLQLFQNTRANTWVFIGRPGGDDSEYRHMTDGGDRRRRRQATVDKGTNYDLCASIALDKFSRGLQRHVGRVNRAKVEAAEIYIISNRDMTSMRRLDLWLDYIETGETLPLFSREPKEYSLPSLSSFPPGDYVDILHRLVKDDSPEALVRVKTTSDLPSIFSALVQLDKQGLLLRCFSWLLQNILSLPLDPHAVLSTMLSSLSEAPFLAIAFGRAKWDEILPNDPSPKQSDNWTAQEPGNKPVDRSDTQSLSEELATTVENATLPIIKAFILSVNQAGTLAIGPFQSMLSRLSPGTISIQGYVDLVELIALTVRSPDTALDILLECLETESERIVAGGPSELVRRTVRNLTGIAIEHVAEAQEVARRREELINDMKDVTHEDKSAAEDGYARVELSLRLDARGGTPELSAHVRLTAAAPPTNAAWGTLYSIDGLVVRSELGRVVVKCLHPLPPFHGSCSWELEHCGTFVTAKTTLEAVRTLARERELCTQVAGPLLGTPPGESGLVLEAGPARWEEIGHLNESQNKAIGTALEADLVCLWGPPGTGKTETIVEMICALQEKFAKARVLVTAPTHNAVDNAMRRYVQRVKRTPLVGVMAHAPLRVSTDFRKVADDLRAYTCDAMVGKEVYSDFRAMNDAKKRIKACPIIFTTCIGAGLGLLRSQHFDIVMVDEASQQTEPASLVPLVKGCSKAVLVGDHVQLRPTVQQYSLAVDFDVSLFERLYTNFEPQSEGDDPRSLEDGSVRRLMLDTQYRMHPSVAAFSSAEFYNGSLKTGITPHSRPLAASKFPWPVSSTAGRYRARMVFIQCAALENLGKKSKENLKQVEICARVCDLLTTSATEVIQEEGNPDPGCATTTAVLPLDRQSIAVLTPYTAQAELLKSKITAKSAAGLDVSSIDGFQGREAEVVVFVTVRCNQHREIGFLRDMRRLNVALTRAKAGLVVIGDRATLTEGTADHESAAVWKRLIESMVVVVDEKVISGVD